MKNTLYTKKHFRYLIIVLMILLNVFSNQSKAQLVLVPDSNFRNALIVQGFGSCFTGSYIDSTCALVQNCTKLDLSNNTIADLIGIESFHNLDTLNVSGNNLTIILSLPDSLKHLDCTYNYITTLPTLPISLISLGCSNNQISNLPSLPASLTSLFCEVNQLTNISSLPNLTQLYCSFNQLTSLPTLPHNLVDLVCSDNQLSQLPTLPDTLFYLNCSNNVITSLPNLPFDLQFITCNNNQLINLPPLPLFLRDLNCSHNNLISLQAFPTFGTFQNLTCSYNQLTNIPALPNYFSELDCSHNQLLSINNLPNTMDFINCSYNQLTSIPDLPDLLGTFDCSNNPNLACLPKLKTINTLNFTSTNVTCLSNYGTVLTSSPALSSISLCDFFNPYSCNTNWNISGKTYFDVDTNCVFNNIDFNEKYIKIKLFRNGTLVQQALSGGEGYYSLDTDSLGIYQTEIDTSNFPLSIRCPISYVFSDTLTISDSLKYNRDFSLNCKDGFDLSV